MRTRLRAAARAEFVAAARWYLREAGARTARNFEQAVAESLALLVTQPQIGTRGVANTRHWALKDFPYTLVYHMRADGLTVVAVAHQRRRPDYWHEEA